MRIPISHSPQCGWWGLALAETCPADSGWLSIKCLQTRLFREIVHEYQMYIDPTPWWKFCTTALWTLEMWLKCAVERVQFVLPRLPHMVVVPFPDSQEHSQFQYIMHRKRPGNEATQNKSSPSCVYPLSSLKTLLHVTRSSRPFSPVFVRLITFLVWCIVHFVS